MLYEARQDEFLNLSSHPEASAVRGESGIEYLSLPENALQPHAQKYDCPLTGTARYREVLVVPVFADGSPFAAPYEG